MTRRSPRPPLPSCSAIAALTGLGASAASTAATDGPERIVPDRTVMVNGTSRSAVVHVPQSVADRPDQQRPAGAAPPRWRWQPAELHRHARGLVEASDANGFIVVFPQGTPIAIPLPGGSTGYVWNAGSCCAVAAREDIDDVAFLDELIRSLEQSLPVDADRVVMSGHSNGAMMAWRLACERGGVLAAAMPVSGSLEIADPASCAPRGTSLLAVHGDADRNHPLEGGTGTRSVSGVSYRPFADSVAAYVAAAACRARPAVSGERLTTTSRYPGVDRGATVTSVVLHGADHPWPGGIASGIGIQGTPFPDWSATDALVALVSGHELIGGLCPLPIRPVGAYGEVVREKQRAPRGESHG